MGNRHKNYSTSSFTIGEIWARIESPSVHYFTPVFNAEGVAAGKIALLGP